MFIANHKKQFKHFGLARKRKKRKTERLKTILDTTE